MKHLALICIAGLSVAAPAFGQSSLKSQVPGTYTLASIYDELADGKKNDTWGPEVKGSLILTPTGQFSVQIIGSNRNKTVAHTPREPVGPIVTYYGTYTWMKRLRPSPTTLLAPASLAGSQLIASPLSRCPAMA